MMVIVSRLFLFGFLIFGFGCVSSSRDGKIMTMQADNGFVIYSSDDSRSALHGPSDRSKTLAMIDDFKKKIKSNPRSASARLGLAELRLILGQFDAAENLCRYVLKRDSRNLNAKKILAQISLRRGNFDLASIYLESLGGQRSTDSSVLNMLALIEVQRGNNSRALSLFQDALKRDPSDLAARMNLGVIFVKYRMFSQGAVEFERVLKIVPDHTDALIHLAVVEIARGRDDVAEKLLRTVLNREEANPLALYNLAIVLKNQKHYEDALASIKAYLKTAKGRAQDNDLVFALVDDIKQSQVENGQEVSDEDLHQIANSSVGGRAARRAMVKDSAADADSGTKVGESRRAIGDGAEQGKGSDNSIIELEETISK